MRRYVYLALFVLVLITPFVMRRLIAPPGLASAPAAKNAPRLVVLTPHNQDIRREFALTFSAWHRENFGVGVVMDYRTIGGTNDIRRQLESMYRPYRLPGGKRPPEEQVPIDADVVWGGGDFFFTRELKQDLGILRPLPISRSKLDDVYPNPTIGGVRLYDGAAATDGTPQPAWVGVC